MFWLDNDSGVTTPPAIPAVVSSTRQYFTEGGGGDQPSIPGGEWFNMMTDELLAVLAEAGITPDKANHTQLAAAMAAMFPKKTQFAASLAISGYQKLPSGLIIQWGWVTVQANQIEVVSLPISFPVDFYQVLVSHTSLSALESAYPFGGAIVSSLSTFSVKNYYTESSLTFSYCAIGV